MKIGPSDTNPVVTGAQNDRKASGPTAKTGGANPQSSAAAPAAAAPASSQVEISSAASQLNNSDASFDSAKVDRIAQAIRSGNFKIHPEAIADKLISNAKELLSGKTIN
jgi:negative regulator of flagellin synthesis FlgM